MVAEAWGPGSLSSCPLFPVARLRYLFPSHRSAQECYHCPVLQRQEQVSCQVFNSGSSLGIRVWAQARSARRSVATRRAWGAATSSPPGGRCRGLWVPLSRKGDTPGSEGTFPAVFGQSHQGTRGIRPGHMNPAERGWNSPILGRPSTPGVCPAVASCGFWSDVCLGLRLESV